MSRFLERHAPYVPPLVVGRLADTTTTLYGLTVAGIYERNAVVAALIEALGPGGGMLVANLLSIGAVVLVVELGVAALRPDGTADWPVSERTIVEFGYLPSMTLSFAAATYNLGVIGMA